MFLFIVFSPLSNSKVKYPGIAPFWVIDTVNQRASITYRNTVSKLLSTKKAFFLKFLLFCLLGQKVAFLNGCCLRKVFVSDQHLNSGTGLRRQSQWCQEPFSMLLHHRNIWLPGDFHSSAQIITHPGRLVITHVLPGNGKPVLGVVHQCIQADIGLACGGVDTHCA